MARYRFRLPDIGEGIAEAEIVAWHVAVGDVIEEDAPLADLMTDKATVEMSTPVGGRVVALHGEVGAMAAIGSILAEFDVESDDAGEPEQPPVAEVCTLESAQPQGAPEPAASAPDTVLPVPDEAAVPAIEPVATPERTRVLASPAVRRRAADLGVDLGQVRCEGDRVRHGDLDAYLRYAGGPAKAAPGDRITEVKVTGLRRRIADNMAAAKRAIPHFAYVEETDVTALEALRGTLNAGRGERPKLTLLPFLIRAVARAAAEFPMVNARYDDEGGVVRRYGAVHVGIATQTEAGLTVPVLRDAGERDVWALAAEIARLAAAARAGQATREELSGSTITITSLGPLGGIVSTPIVNRPEVAIVGINRIVERPAVVDGRIEVRKLMNLSSSFDHRVVDGMDAAGFIQAVRRRIETPALLFIG